MNPRMENIHQLTKYGTELTVKIPTTVLRHPDFKEQQKALENLKKDNELAIFEENNKIEVKRINGVDVTPDYTVITIRRLNEWTN